MPRLRLAAALIVSLGAPPCAASWLHCSASGSNDTGPFGFETTIADVRETSPAALTALQARLAAYIVKNDPEAHGITAKCAVFDDEVDAAQHYSRALNAVSRKLGWDHTTALAPHSWLASNDLIDTPLEP